MAYTVGTEIPGSSRPTAPPISSAVAWRRRRRSSRKITRRCEVACRPLERSRSMRPWSPEGESRSIGSDKLH